MITRLHSEALDLPIKHDSNTGTATVQDMIYKQNRFVEYSTEEQKIFNIFDIDKTVHSVKKIFDGTIIKWSGTIPVTEKVITETGIIEPSQGDLF